MYRETLRKKAEEAENPYGHETSEEEKPLDQQISMRGVALR